MNKKFKKQKNERLSEWCERLSTDVMWDHIDPYEIREILKEISIKSYVQGTTDAWG